MSSQEAKDIREIVNITNKSGQNLQICIEPWGDELAFPAESHFRIEADGPGGQGLEIEIATAHIVICGWVGSRLTVFDGATVVRDYPIRVPPVP